MMLLITLTLLAVQADTLTLSQAYVAASEFYPRAREAGISRDIRDLRIQNLDARFLPSMSLGGQAVYQSDVPSIPISVPGFSLPSVSRDQYRVGLSINQLVFDGGLTTAQKDIERSSSDISGQEVVIAIYGLREQVEAAWFSILLSQAETVSLGVLEEDLQARLDQAKALVGRGVATASNSDILEAEMIRLRQRKEAVNSRHWAGIDILGELTGWSVDQDARLALPANETMRSGKRPEEDLFELSRRMLDNQAVLASRRTRPRVTSFVDAAVGRPQGLDVFQNDIGPFVSLGVRVGWSFWDWNSARRDREAIVLQAEAITAQEEAFMQRIRTLAAQVKREIERLEASLVGDLEIVALRARVSAEARSQLDNGVITATDYLVERNAEHRAGLDGQFHRIQLAQARVRLVSILGAL